MNQLADIQGAFACALLDAAEAVPRAIRGAARRRADRRFAVYRNNVVAGLIDALAQRFPVVRRLVGDEFFRAMAQLYVTARPPTSPIMMLYGETFPEFIDEFAPAAAVPYLGDIARLEIARGRAYHAADAVPKGPQVFAALPMDRLTRSARAVAPVSLHHRILVSDRVDLAGEQRPGPCGSDRALGRRGSACRATVYGCRSATPAAWRRGVPVLPLATWRGGSRGRGRNSSIGEIRRRGKSYLVDRIKRRDWNRLPHACIAIEASDLIPPAAAESGVTTERAATRRSVRLIGDAGSDALAVKSGAASHPCGCRACSVCAASSRSSIRAGDRGCPPTLESGHPCLLCRQPS